MTRLRIVLTSIAVALSLFAPVAARPTVAAENGLGLSDVVFAFDFSGSIYCYKNGNPIPKESCPDSNLNENLADGVASLAEKIETFKDLYSGRAIKFKVVRFGNGKTVLEKVAGVACNGNTNTSVQLLIDCLKQIAQDYRDPSKELGGTNFVPSLNELTGISNRCGIILFTDGKPDDRDKALEIRSDENYKCAILPVGLIPENLTEEESNKITDDKIQLD